MTLIVNFEPLVKRGFRGLFIQNQYLLLHNDSTHLHFFGHIVLQQISCYAGVVASYKFVQILLSIMYKYLTVKPKNTIGFLQFCLSTLFPVLLVSYAKGCQSLRPFSTSAPSHFGLFPLRPFATSAHPHDTSAYNADFFGPTRPTSKVTSFSESQNDKHHCFYFTLKFFFSNIIFSFFCKFLQILNIHWFCYTVVLFSMLRNFTCPFFDTLYSKHKSICKLSAAGEQTINIIWIIPFNLGDFVYSAFPTQCHR